MNNNDLFIALGIIGLAYVFLKKLKQRQEFLKFPAVGRSGIFTSYIDAFRLLSHTTEMIQEGYDKYSPRIFRLPSWTGWILIATGEKYIDELRRAPDDVLSIHEASNELLAATYILGEDVTHNLYHLELIRSHFNRSLGNIFPTVHDEIKCAFQQLIPPTGDSWTTYKIHEPIRQTVSRTMNRVFMGLPICRTPEYIQCTMDIATTLFLRSQIINLFPDFLKPLVAKFCNVEKIIRVASEHIGPLMEERRRLQKKLGKNYPDKPDDMLTWLMERAPLEGQNLRNIVLRLLALNAVSVHSTSLIFTLILLDLVARPEYIQPIREEIESTIAASDYGWHKDIFKKMPKLDSFMRESMRLQQTGPYTMNRVALKEFVFSDGTKVPEGTWIAVGHNSRHLSEDVYKDAKTFDGFRFSKLGETESVRSQTVTPSVNFLQFGYGRDACPGRFMAVMEMKIMMAHILLNYDIKAGKSPKHRTFKGFIAIDEEAEIIMRKRYLG